MSNTSFAAQAVANGPMTAAPPSFDGHGWLVVINLALMTATALLALGTVIGLAISLWRDRRRGPLVTMLRWLVLIAFSGMLVRTGVEAVTLWGWDPYDPERTGQYLLLKRLLDPFGAAAYFAAICLFTMTRDALVASLERQPFPERLVGALPKLKRPAILVGLSAVAAILVVSFR